MHCLAEQLCLYRFSQKYQKLYIGVINFIMAMMMSFIMILTCTMELFTLWKTKHSFPFGLRWHSIINVYPDKCSKSQYYFVQLYSYGR